MSINDMMKLQGVTGATRLTPGEHGAAAHKADASKNSSVKQGPAGGVAVEVGTKIDAGQAPVEASKVANIRSALQEGSYNIEPAQIADAMIAAQLNVVVTS